MQRAKESGEEDNSKATASDDENLISNGAKESTQEDFEMKPIETLEQAPSMDNDKESAYAVPGTIDTSLEDKSSLMNEESEVKSVMNGEVHEGKETSNSSSLEQQTRRPRTRTRIVKLLSRGSLFAIGLAVLVVGGVSSNFTPYVDPWEYDNCTITGE